MNGFDASVFSKGVVFHYNEVFEARAKQPYVKPSLQILKSSKRGFYEFYFILLDIRLF
jgi:hypothetical protein